MTEQHGRTSHRPEQPAVPLARRMVVWALLPLLDRLRAYLNAPLQVQVEQEMQALAGIVEARMADATSTLHGVTDAGVVALAARASVLDAAIGAMAGQVAASTARFDALAAGARRQQAALERLDRQQRLVFDGLLDEMTRLHGDRGVSAQQPDGAGLPQLDRIEQYSYASARRVALPCDGDVLVRSEAGYILCAGSDLAVLATLIETGELERGTRRVIEALLRPGDCFVDVGANIGIHTLAAGRALRRQGAIHAFEPFDATRRLLQNSVWMNGLAEIATIHASAVSSSAGVKPLYLGTSSGHHSLFALGADGGARIDVPTVRLDDVLDQRVDLLKIDAEGAELDVLDGARRLVADNPGIALIAECGPAHLARTGHTIEAWLAAFAACGLAWRAIDPDTGALADTSPALLAAADSTNLLFARPGAPCWNRLLELA